MSKIPTAEEFLNNHPVSGYDEGDYYKPQVEEFMVDFAKLHVKAALEAAAENARAKENPADYGTGEIWVDKKSILSAYPEYLIQ